MDKSLQAVCRTLKKVIWQLKPQYNALSFLLVVGRSHQGKTTLLRQSALHHVSVDGEQEVDIYYNTQGIFLELGDVWLTRNTHHLQHTLKQINRCHHKLKISGIIACIDINEFLVSDPIELAEQSKLHAQLLENIGLSLHYRLDTTIIFTKIDTLAGFSEFYQHEHPSELTKPLGFSLHWTTQNGRFISNYKAQFEQFIEAIGQQVMDKMHPARSSIKRTLIREFPLQLASFGRAIQSFIKMIPSTLFNVQAIYFTSGQQGGISLDRLNQKIQQEYALTIQDKYPQSINHRAYFIEGALTTCQQYTKRHPKEASLPQKWTLGSIAGGFGLVLIWLGYQHVTSVRLLDKASKELIHYDTLSNQNNHDAAALYHLSKATSTLDKMKTNGLFLPAIHTLQTQLHTRTQQHIQGDFLPTILSEIEQVLVDATLSQTDRYEALKIYLMLEDPAKFSQPAVLNWFANRWKDDKNTRSVKKKLTLIQQTLRQPLPPISINQQIVSDVRNYLNALPVTYLYYSFAKAHFSSAKEAIAIPGFQLAVNNIPVYYTKSGFQNVIQQLPTISAELQNDNWVLARQDVQDLAALLQQAYCYEYASWWENFMRRTNLTHVQNYGEAKQLIQTLHQGDSIRKLVTLMQHNTAPEFGDAMNTFNQAIASKFTELNVTSNSSIRELTHTIHELEKLLVTLTLVNDNGRTAFHLAKARFEGDSLSNPLSALYNQVKHLPEPLASWTKQIADDTWFIEIKDAKNYINQQWQQSVIQDYEQTIAKRYPFDASQTKDVAIADFERFFSMHGILNTFVDQYLKPFLDTSQAEWQPKELNNYVLPISADTINELIRANIITHMFFPAGSSNSQITFSLQKLYLDPVVASFRLHIGNTKLHDTQDSDSFTQFSWPQNNAELTLYSIEGERYELREIGPWAFFKILQKVNVLVDEQDSSALQILFEVNGNSGRYLLKAGNPINPFIPGILNGFTLQKSIA